jgi:hypothetical protein
MEIATTPGFWFSGQGRLRRSDETAVSQRRDRAAMADTQKTHPKAKTDGASSATSKRSTIQERLHQALNYQSPNQFESQHAQQLAG